MLTEKQSACQKIFHSFSFSFFLLNEKESKNQEKFKSPCLPARQAAMAVFHTSFRYLCHSHHGHHRTKSCHTIPIAIGISLPTRFFCCAEIIFSEDLFNEVVGYILIPELCHLVLCIIICLAREVRTVACQAECLP